MSCAPVNVGWSVCQPTAWGIKGFGVRVSSENKLAVKIERRENHRSWLRTGKCCVRKQYQRVIARTPMSEVSGGFVRGKDLVWQIFGKTCDSHCAYCGKTQESL